MRAVVPRRILVAACASTLLSGCWLFPPFLPSTESRTYIVENETDTDWVLELRSDFPTAYAIPAGETGSVDDWGAELHAIALMTDECEVVHELQVTDEVTSIRITGPATLSLTSVTDLEAEPFVEYWNCPGAFGSEPLGEAGLPGAAGAILVYGEDGLAYVYDPAAGTVEPAIPGGDSSFYDSGHTWSPDGTQVAYAHATETSPTTAIYVANADGTDAHLVVAAGTSPQWSPDGRRIAYLDGDPFARDPGIWVLDLDTDERVQVADGVGAFSWSPDGSRFAYASGVTFGMSPEATPSEVHVVDVDGSNDRLVGTTVPFSLGPAWSPDGSRLAFASVPVDEELDGFSDESSIAVYELESGALTTVAPANGASFVEPAWSPDGSRLAFSALELGLSSGAAYVGIVDAHGGEVSRHGSEDSSFISTPAWSPDGAWVVAAVQTGTDVSTVLVGLDPDNAAGDLIALATGVLSVVAWRAE